MTLQRHDERVEVTSAHPEEGRAELAFARVDSAADPQHPTLIAIHMYFGPTAALLGLDLARPGAETALTQTDWTCPQLAEPTPPTAGTCTFPNPDEPSFEIELRTASGERFAVGHGTGVEFATRDFKAWRAASKAKAQAAATESSIDHAPAEALGLPNGWLPFVSPIEEVDGIRQVRALITSEDGFPPVHPLHDGSGDHVNVPHLFDCVMQAAHLFRGQPVRCIGGEATFQAYIELDIPFVIAAVDDGDVLQLEVSQLGKRCAAVGLRLVPLGE